MKELRALSNFEQAKATTSSNGGGRKNSLYDQLFHNLAIDVGPGGTAERSREIPESINRKEAIKSSIAGGGMRYYANEDNQDRYSDEFEPISLRRMKNGASSTTQANHVASYRKRE